MIGNKESRIAWLLAVAALTLGSTLGCSGSKGDRGPAGASPDGGGCTITQNADGTATVTCADGTTATLTSGQDGAPGNPGAGCTAASVDGGVQVTCGDASTTIPNGQTGSTGQPGQPGLNAGQTPGLKATASVKAPANGKYYAQGEKIVYTATLTTADGSPVDLSYFSSAALYMNGPRDVLKDKTRCELLGCSTDRTQNPHYYIDLTASPAPAGLVVNGNTITFTTKAIPANEDPGTYTFGLRLVPKDYVFDQTFLLTDVQIGTETVEPLIVGVDKADGTGSCADCHLGAANGKEYMHHIDPGYNPTGSPALDSVPVRTCLMCHNQDGYSAIQVCADGTKASHSGCADGSTPTYMPDPIVRRVHGVHMGENLLSKLDTGASGDFEAYAGLAFPAGIKDCTKCHNGTDDDWKTKPSREACGACHDQVNWTTGDFEPPRPTSVPCFTASDCSSLSALEIPACDTSNPVDRCADLSLPDSNGVCADGSTPAAAGICTLTKHGGGPQTDDSKCDGCHVGSGSLAPIETVHQIAAPDFKVSADIAMSAPTNGTDYEGSETPTVTITVKDSSGTALDPATFTAANKDVAELFVSGPRDDTHPVLTTAASNPDPNGFYVYNDLLADASPADPKFAPTSSAFVYNLDPVTGLEPGTYTVFFVVTKAGHRPESWAVKNFQVGTATEEPMVATNCVDCHEDSRMHEGYFAVTFNPDICKNCHDYQAQNANNAAGWGAANSNYGFGAAPLSRRVHGVHFGKYLSHPEQNTSGIDDIVFPQDVRNCQKCHDSATTSGTWQDPGRVACLGCHDSDSDQAHGALMTVDPTPSAPYSGDEVESCESCHGAGKDFAVSKVHNITDPYVPPYPR